VRIAIENCPMIFSWDEWPAARTSPRPAIWDEMFSIVDSELRAQPRPVAPRLADDRLRARRPRLRATIFHVHAKDMEIDRDGLYRNGTARSGWAGRCRASRPRRGALGPLRRGALRVGYDFVISIEHEDPLRSSGTEELVKRGFLIARDALRPLVH
jgi:hypothetical protein